MPGITRIHGAAASGAFYGGYQPTFFSVAGSGFNTNYAATGSAFELAVRGIEAVATVVILGTPGSAGFIVAVDGGSFRGRGDNTGYAADNSTDTIAAAVYAASGINPTVTVVTIGGGSNGLGLG